MKKFKPLTDFIHVANLADIFWNNNSDLYPTSAPEKGRYKLIQRTRPIFESPYVGHIILTGDYNHAIYDGKYYQLKKIEAIDLTDSTYKYQLIYDIIIDLLDKGGEIKGTLIKTNDPEILEKVIQTTEPILTTPAKLTVINFGNESFNWKKHCKITIPETKEKFYENRISAADWDKFVARVRLNIIGKYLATNKWEFKKDRYVYNRTDINKLYILDRLPFHKVFSWKNLVLLKISDTFKNLEDKIITTQTQISGSFFAGKKAISHSEHSIGTNIENDLQIDSIDLSGLTDIIPVDFNGAPKEPDTRANKDDLILDDISSAPLPFGWMIQLGRIPRLPIAPVNQVVDKESLLPTNDYYAVDNSEVGGYSGLPPQKIEFKEGLGFERPGYLWYLDRNNIAITDGHRASTKLRSGEKLENLFWVRSIYSPSDYFDSYFFNKIKRENIPSLGFFIFQIKRGNQTWDDFEYTGASNLSTIKYRSGINSNLKTYFDYSNKWWRDVPNEVKYMNGTKELSALMLDTHLFSWLTIAPSDKSYTYKYLYYRGWGVKEIFKDRSDGYVAHIMNHDINANGVNIKNPFAEDGRITAWLDNREHLIDQVSIYSVLQLAEPISKGDIFFSSHEYDWFDLSFGGDELPFQLPAIYISQYLKNLKRFERTTNKGEKLSNYTNDFKSTINAWEINHAAYQSFAIGTTFLSGLAVGVFSIMLIPLGLTISLSILDKNIRESKETLKNNLIWMGEFFGGSKLDISFLNNCLILYLHKGKIKLGIYKEYRKEFHLSKDLDNVIDKVDGITSTTTKIFHIKGFDNNEIVYEGPTRTFSEDQELNALAQAYASISGSTNGKINRYTETELSKGLHIFDLKGTDWYAIFWNGRVHLLAKTNELFTNLTVEIASLKYEEGLNPTTFEKINQKSELIIYGQSFPLNTKFLFKDDKFNVRIQKVTPKDKVTPISDIHVKVINKHDTINTWIKVDKPLAIGVVNTIDPIQYALLKQQIEHTNVQYQQSKAVNEMMMEGKKIEAIRRREDLEMEWHDALASSLSIGIGGFAHMGGRASSIFRNVARSITVNQLSGQKIRQVPKYDPGRAYLTGLGIGDAGSLVLAGYSAYRAFSRYGLNKQRASEDESMMYAENTMSMFHRKQNYEHEYKSQVIRLNSMTNTYIRSGTNDTEIQTAFNKANNWEDINIQVYLPTEDQKIIIDHIFNTHGCDCVSDHYKNNPLIIKNGMKPGLYKFSNMEGGAISSSLTTDVYINDAVRGVFENGTKFVDYVHEFTNEETEEIEVDIESTTPVVIIYDVENIDKWPREKWGKFVSEKSVEEILNTIKNTNNFGLTDEERQANKDLDPNNKEDFLNRINEIISNRKEGEIFVAPLPPPKEDCEDQLKELERLKEEKEQLENNLTQAINRANTLSNEYRDLETKKSEAEKLKNLYLDQKTQLEKDKQILENTKNNLEEELRKCKIEFTNLSQTKDFCDRTNSAFIKELEKSKKQCEAQLKIKDAEIELLNSGITAQRTKITNINKEKEQLEKNCEEFNKTIEALKKDKEDLINNVTQITNNLNQINKEKEELQKNLTQASNRAETLSREYHTLETKKNEEEKLKNLYLNQKTQLEREKTELNKEKTTLENEKTILEKQKDNLIIELEKTKQKCLEDLEEKVREITSLKQTDTDKKIKATIEPKHSYYCKRVKLAKTLNEITAIKKTDLRFSLERWIYRGIVKGPVVVYLILSKIAKDEIKLEEEVKENKKEILEEYKEVKEKYIESTENVLRPNYDPISKSLNKIIADAQVGGLRAIGGLSGAILHYLSPFASSIAEIFGNLATVFQGVFQGLALYFKIPIKIADYLNPSKKIWERYNNLNLQKGTVEEVILYENILAEEEVQITTTFGALIMGRQTDMKQIQKWSDYGKLETDEEQNRWLEKEREDSLGNDEITYLFKITMDKISKWFLSQNDNTNKWIKLFKEAFNKTDYTTYYNQVFKNINNEISIPDLRKLWFLDYWCENDLSSFWDKNSEVFLSESNRVKDVRWGILDLAIASGFANSMIFLNAISLEIREVYDEMLTYSKPTEDIPSILKSEVEFTKRIIPKHEIDIKIRDDGGSAFRDLLISLADAFIWFRKSDMDQNLNKYPIMRDVILKIDELENTPIMDRLIDIMGRSKWKDYVNWMSVGGEQPSTITSIITDMKKIDNMQNMFTVNGIKSIIDELYWTSFKAFQKLRTEIEKDRDLEYFFKHVCPGKSVKLYENIFGSPEYPITSKLYLQYADGFKNLTPMHIFIFMYLNAKRDMDRLFNT